MGAFYGILVIDQASYRFKIRAEKVVEVVDTACLVANRVLNYHLSNLFLFGNNTPSFSLPNEAALNFLLWQCEQPNRAKSSRGASSGAFNTRRNSHIICGDRISLRQKAADNISGLSKFPTMLLQGLSSFFSCGSKNINLSWVTLCS